MNHMSFRRSGKCFAVVLSALVLSISLLVPASVQADMHLVAPSRTIDWRPEKPLADPFKLGFGEFLRIDYVGEIPR